MAKTNSLKIWLLLMFITSVCITSSFVSALPVVEINVSPSFSTGDVIKFSYTIVSQQNENIQYVVSASCMSAQSPLLELKELNLVSNKIFSGEYVYAQVDNNMQSGKCVASVSIIEPYYSEFSKSFDVSALSDFSITASTCKDTLCSEAAKVFKSGETIYLNYDSSVKDAVIIATLQKPDSTIEQITLPTSFNADKVGTYELTLKATKIGYNNAENNVQFAVIKEDVVVQEGPLAGSNAKKTFNPLFWILTIIFILFVAAILFYIFYLKKRLTGRGNNGNIALGEIKK